MSRVWTFYFKIKVKDLPHPLITQKKVLSLLMKNQVKTIIKLLSGAWLCASYDAEFGVIPHYFFKRNPTHTSPKRACRDNTHVSSSSLLP
jgi:hypothetical protein